MVVATDLPHPPRGGNHLRYLQNLEILDHLGYAVHLVAGVTRPDSAHAGPGPDAVLAGTVPIPSLGTGAGERLARTRAMLIGSLRRPPVDPWGTAYNRAGIDQAVIAAAERLRPDVVLVRSLFAHLLPRLRAPGRLLVADAHDLGGRQAAAMLKHAPSRARAGLQIRKLGATRAESALQEADEIWAASPQERQYLEKRSAGRPVVLVRNGIPVEPHLPPKNERATELVLLAGYGYPPNLAAAKCLVEEVLPLVQRERPDVSVTLIGRDLPSAQVTAWESSSVRYLGVVSDPEPHLSRSAALVFLPSWSTGTPLKVAEALARGIPVVANEAAIQGLGVAAGSEALVGTTAEDHAAHVLRVLTDPRLALALRESGHKFAIAHLSREAVEREVRSSSILGDGS